MALTKIPISVLASDLKKLKTDLDAIAVAIGKLVTLTNELKTDMSAHVHGGVTTGSSNTAAAATISAADATAVTITTE
jgi:hypothetical protein